MSNSARGTVKFYNTEKNFGFIVPDEGNKDIFFHKSGLLVGSINENDQVEFEIEDGDRGPSAVNIKVV